MNSKTLLFVIFLLLFSIDLSAQKLIKLTFKPIEIKNRNFNIVEVIDARFTDSLHHIGVVHVGIGNRREYAILEDSLVKVIKKHLSQSVPNLENKASIILKINSFGVSEFTMPSYETAFLNANFDFILQSDSGSYKLNNARVFWDESGMDATARHKSQIPLAFEVILKNFANQYDSIINTKVKIDESELKSVRLPKFLTDSVMKIGTYKNFAEFYNNSPSIAHKTYEFKGQTFLLVKDEKKTGFRELKDKDTFWGFCDGKNIFISQYGVFYPITKKDNKIGFYGEDIAKKRRNQALWGASFGLIGAIIYNATMDNSNPSSNSKNSKYYEIDWQTGSFILGKE